MNKKEKFLNKDRLVKGITNDGFFKISVVKTTELVQLASKKHEMSPVSTVILGRALTGTMLLASELKGEERVRLEVQSNGTISYLVCEANALGEVRGYMNNPQAVPELNSLVQLGDVLGIGVLSFYKTLYNEARPITGTVELKKGNISEDLAYYLLQSEQIPSALTLDVQIADDGSVLSAGGVMVQALPGAPLEMIDRIQDNIRNITPIGPKYLEGKYIDDLMHDVTYPIEAHEISRFPVHFFCRCNKDRFVHALEMLSISDLEEMYGKSQELVCHYCNRKYEIEPAEITRIMKEMRIKMN